MIFTESKLPGVLLVELERLGDERGFFARSYCHREFTEHGLNPRVVQCNVSFNKQKGTLRGLHSQAEPCQEAKLVRCTRGAIYDVIVDLRPDSLTYLQHLAVTLTANNHTMLYVPEGVYHGFLTLEDNSEIFYQMSEYYLPGKALGVRWDDPAFNIDWPEEVKVISKEDANYPDYRLSGQRKNS